MGFNPYFVNVRVGSIRPFGAAMDARVEEAAMHVLQTSTSP